MRELLALGSAVGVWEDLEQARAMFPHADVGAVNDAGKVYTGRLELWATLHVEHFATWQRHRERSGFNTDYKAICNKGAGGVRVDIVKGAAWSADSGLYLCQVAAMQFGYQRIVACGMPLDAQPHFFSETAWFDWQRFRRGWIEASEQVELRGKIRSMSGWTRELLGGPEDWLAEPASAGRCPK